jgi:hypothetical protein
MVHSSKAGLAVQAIVLGSCMVGLGGCASKAFVRTDGPVAERGVSISLVSQSCDREIDPNWSSADILGLDLRVRVSNGGESVVAFDPGKTALVAGGRSSPPRRGDAAAEVAPGNSQTFIIHFLQRDGTLACNVPMTLAFKGAVAIGETPVTFKAISFLASNDDL